MLCGRDSDVLCERGAQGRHMIMHGVRHSESPEPIPSHCANRAAARLDCMRGGLGQAHPPRSRLKAMPGVCQSCCHGDTSPTHGVCQPCCGLSQSVVGVSPNSKPSEGSHWGNDHCVYVCRGVVVCVQRSSMSRRP